MSKPAGSTPKVISGSLPTLHASYAPLGAFAKFCRIGGGAKASVDAG